MDGLTGAYSRLQNAQIPLKGRIELSRHVLENNQYFLPNKNQVLADWICQELHHLHILQAKKSGEELLDLRKNKTELWKLLHELLKRSQDELVVLRQRFLPILFGEFTALKEHFESDGLNNDDADHTTSCALSVFGCCRNLIQNPQMSLTLFNKLDNMVQCLEEVLGCFLAMLFRPCLRSIALMDELSKLVTEALQQYGTIQRQQATQRKIFESLCETLLHLLLMVKYTMCENSWGLQESVRMEISSRIDVVINAGLFHRDHLLSYKSAVDSLKSEEPSPKKSKISSYTEKLFEVLRKSVEGNMLAKNKETSNLWRKSIPKSLPFILESFLEATKDEAKVDRTAKFNFFVELYSLIPLSEASSTQAVPEVDRMTVLSQMLQIMLDYDVYQIAEDNVNNQPMLKWLVDLTESLMHSCEDYNASLFQCLNTLLKLNHKILENFLENFIEKCLIKSQQCSKEAEQEKIKVFCNLIETYCKLQQVEYLISGMVRVIKRLGQNLGNIPVDAITKLSQAFEQCPSNLTLGLYKLFLNEMKSLIECLKGSSQDELSTIDSCGHVLEMITVLFVTFLTNSSFNAADQHGGDIKKTSSLKELLEDTKVSLLAPLIKAFPMSKKSCQKEVGFSTLYLLHGLNGVLSYLSCHEVIDNLANDGLQISWNKELGTFSPDHSWDSVEMVTKNACIRFCMDMLVAQRARCLLASTNPNLEEISQLVTFLYNFDNSPAISKAVRHSWNGDPYSVNNKNYAVAHWTLVAKHAPLLIPYCNDHQAHGFAKWLLRSLSCHHDEESLQENLLTLNQISCELLEVAELHALSSSQTAIVSEFWKMVGEAADKVAGGRFPQLTKVFSWTAGEKQLSKRQDMAEEETEDHVSPNLDNDCAASFAEDLAQVMKDEAKKMTSKHLKKEKPCVKDGQGLCDIKNLLSVLQQLPCSSFTTFNQLHCILGLLATDVLVERCATSDVGIAVQLLLRHSLLVFLQECLQHRDFTAWRVVDVSALLAWIHATIIHHCRSFEEPLSEVQSSLANISNSLLGAGVALAVKSRKKSSLSAICKFNDRLLASIRVSTEIPPEYSEILEMIFTIVFACTQLLEQKLISRPSRSMLSGVVMDTAVSLIDQISQFLKYRGGDTVNDGGRSLKVEVLVLRLAGIITRAMGLVSRSGISENTDGKEERLVEWSQVVASVFKQALEKLEKEPKSLATPDAYKTALVYVKVLEDISQCKQEHRDILPDDFQANTVRLCLRILRTCGSCCEEMEQGQPKQGDKREELRQAIFRLFSTILQVNDGENCIAVIENLVDLTVDEVDEDPTLKLLTGYSVLKRLLAEKVVKKRKKELRAKLGKILVILLSKMSTNVEVVALVLEIIDAVVTLGSGSLYPQDLSLVFQALALARDIKVDDQRRFARIFTARFKILSWSLFYYPDYVYGVVHLFLTSVRDLLSSLLTQGSKLETDSDLSTILPSCAQKMARLYQELSSHKDVFSKYSTYFLADYIHLLSTQGMPGLIRESLIEGAHYLFDICKEDSLAKVHVYLPNSERELFRSLKEDFCKHHKFKGNA